MAAGSTLSGPWQSLTPAEVDALPEGPFVKRVRELTAEENAAGKLGKYIEEVSCPPVKFRGFAKDDPLFIVDSDGRCFSIGEFADGSFYKHPWGF